MRATLGLLRGCHPSGPGPRLLSVLRTRPAAAPLPRPSVLPGFCQKRKALSISCTTAVPCLPAPSGGKTCCFSGRHSCQGAATPLPKQVGGTARNGCLNSRAASITSSRGRVSTAAMATAMETSNTAVAEDGPLKAYVRCPPGDDKLVVSVTLGTKTCNLNRPTDEPLEKALARLAKNLTAKPAKKEKRKKGQGTDSSVDDPAAPPAVLYEDEQGTTPVDVSLPNGEAWRRGRVLAVGEARFVVEYNPPTVDKLSVDRLLMVGYPTAAAVSLSFADPDACTWRWSAKRAGSTVWEDRPCASQFYTPGPEDEGCVLRVECVPGAWRGDAGQGDVWRGEAVSAVTGAVSHGPATCSATLRSAHTPRHVAAPAFRILSYNILADQYAGSDYAQNVLFNYCPKECLDPDYRRPLVLRELLGYHADVLCLQEVDERTFTDYLRLHLGLRGYSGHYTNKQGKVREGSATFWRTDRYRALAHRDIRLRDAFAAPLPPLHAQFQPLLDASPELAHALQRVTTIAQATLLAPVDPAEGDGCLCVVNTHLFFHPYAPHIRTMHTAAILEEAAAFLQQAAEDPRVGATLGGSRPTVLFCGDLNSDLNDGIPGVVELLRSGKLAAEYWDWVQGAAFKWGMGEEDAEAMAQGTAQIAAAQAQAQTQDAGKATGGAAAPAALPPPSPGSDPAAAAAAAGSLFAADGHAFDSAESTPSHPIAVTGIDIASPFTLRSADDLQTPYTNYTSGYKALLDYVWYEESTLRVAGTAPIPTVEELGSFIPSRAFPSDHLAVVYDFEWRGQEANK